MEYIWKSYRDHHPRGDSPAYIRLHSKKSRCRWYPIFTSIGNNCKHLLHIPLFLYPISRVSAFLLLRRSETDSSFEFITLVEKISTSAVRVSSMYSKKSYPIHTRRFGPGKIVDKRRECRSNTRVNPSRYVEPDGKQQTEHDGGEDRHSITDHLHCLSWNM